MMMFLALFLSFLCLLPVAMYLVGKIRDPFHPLVLVGALFYLIGPHRLIFNASAALELLPEPVYDVYLVVSILCILGVYFGWYRAGRSAKLRRIVETPAEPVQYNTSMGLLLAFTFLAISIPVHFLQLDVEHVTSGWFRDLRQLWIAAAIVSVMVIVQKNVSSGQRILAMLALAISLVPPLERFWNYGQRGDTFRIAIVGEMFYFFANRRPSKLTFLSAAACVVVVMGTLHLTRNLVLSGESPNRIDALTKVIPSFFEKHAQKADASDEYIFGAAGMNSCRRTGRYGYGTGITVGFVEHLLPHEWFPRKDIGVMVHAGFDGEAMRDYNNLIIPGGAAPSGVPHSFYELGWACPIIWIIIGYFYRILWVRANFTRNPLPIGLLAGYTISVMYTIAQDVMTGEVNLLYSFLPLLLVHSLCRIREQPTFSYIDAPLLAAER